MKKYSEILIFIFSFIFLNLNIKLVNSSIISNEGPNDITVYKAFELIGGASSQIIFPILTKISRFENALIDLSEICQGIKTKY
jgi:hypothetical protein